METIVKITLWNQDMAALTWDKDKESGVLEFFEEFSTLNLDIAPLIMPLDDIRRGERIFQFATNKGKTFKGLPGLVADSLPDDYGNLVINEWITGKGLDQESVTPVDRLCYVGKRGMGALEYQPATSNHSLDESSLLEIKQLTELANEILNRRAHFKTKLSQGEKSYMDILKVGTSAGGAKPKAIIAYNEKTGEVRSGQVKAPEGFTYWLLKFDGIEDGKLKDNPAGIGNIEYAYYKMAIDCGINMMDSRLLSEGSHAHFMTKRFDRKDDGSKIHTQTLCALAHFDRDSQYSYEQGFQVMRRLSLPYNDMEQFFRRMVFNVIASNHDDHTKNHSFMMDTDGSWRLAPAYDLCYAYSSSGKWIKEHQLSLGNKRDSFVHNDLLAVGRQVGIRSANVLISQITDVVSRWKTYAQDAGVRKEHIEQIAQTHLL